MVMRGRPTTQFSATEQPVLIHWLRYFVLALCFLAVVFSPTSYANEKKNSEATTPDYIRTTSPYEIPDVKVIKHDGKEVGLVEELNDGRPVLVNFIFTSCATICPMITHLFSKVQSKLERKHVKFHLVSISIDPENDTPPKLTEYAKKFHAGEHWDHYTGNLNDIIAIQKGVNVFRGDKMNHGSVVLMRSPSGKLWQRLEGFFSPDQVVEEFEKMILK